MILEKSHEKLDPTNYATTASIAMKYFSHFCMPEKTIAVLDTIELNTSIKEMEWLYHIETTEKKILKRQYKINNIFVDGYDTTTNTAYQFNGCYWHGCLKCYKANTLNKTKQQTMLNLNRYTESISKRIQAQGTKLIQIWEHDWNDYKKSNKLTFPEAIFPLNIRDAFFGGNTQVFKPYVKVNPKTHTIKYVDFTSLYPSINSCKLRPIDATQENVPYTIRYPIGHPERMKPQDVNADLSNVFGFVKCKVIPNPKLYIPVLPDRREKLMFHNQPFVGTFFSEELKYALSLDYQIETIYDVQHFPMSLEQPEKASSIFSEYVKTFYKIKLEADGFPKGVNKEDYIKTIALEEGIILDGHNMKYEKNEGMRFIAKLFLNSLWGKFGQNLNHSQIITFTCPEKWNKFKASDKVLIDAVHIINDDTIDVVYHDKDPFIQPPFKISIPIASATTAYARIRLNQLLQLVNTDAIYCDTDSVIYVDSVEHPHPVKISSLLGDLKDELDGKSITEFIATAPKSYAYQTTDGKSKVKVKGFTLDVQTSKLINLNSMRKMVSQPSTKIYTDAMNFKINKHQREIKTEYHTKTFSVDYDKRIIDWENKTQDKIESYPLGFKGNK